MRYLIYEKRIVCYEYTKIYHAKWPRPFSPRPLPEPGFGASPRGPQRGVSSRTRSMQASFQPQGERPKPDLARSLHVHRFVSKEKHASQSWVCPLLPHCATESALGCRPVGTLIDRPVLPLFSHPITVTFLPSICLQVHCLNDSLCSITMQLVRLFDGVRSYCHHRTRLPRTSSQIAFAFSPAPDDFQRSLSAPSAWLL